MSYYHKYRPQTFAQVRGNEETIMALEGLLTKEEHPHVYLFSGPSGCGKTTIGRILSKQFGCVGDDFKEIDSSTFRGIDSIRDVRNQMNYLPLEGKCRVWLFDEVHKWTNDAQNAALKITEDTPEHVYFILCTTDPQKLIDPLRKRCQTFQVKPLKDGEMLSLLKYVVKKERHIMPDEKVLEQIVDDSMGGPREALNILEKVLAVEPEHQLKVARKTAEEQQQAIELCRVLLRKGSWKEVQSILKGVTDEPESLRRMVLGYCQAILLKESNDRAAELIEIFWDPLYDTGKPGLVYYCYSAIKG